MLYLLFHNNYFQTGITLFTVQLPAKPDVRAAAITQFTLAALPIEREAMKVKRSIEVSTDISLYILLYYLCFSAYNSYVDVAVDTFY